MLKSMVPIIASLLLIGCASVTPTKVAAKEPVVVPNVIIQADNVKVVDSTSTVNESPKIVTCSSLVHVTDTVSTSQNYVTCDGLICVKGTTACRHHRCSCTMIGTDKK